MFHTVLAVCGMLAVAIPFMFAVYRGWKYRTTRDPDDLKRHRTATNIALVCTVLGILFIEAAVRVRPPGHNISTLLWVHLPLAVAFLTLLLVLRFWLTGLRSKHHRLLGHVCTTAFAGTLGTGAVLIWQM